MAQNGHDMGAIHGQASGTPSVSNSVVSSHPQVYMATHDGEGNRLPLMERSFISFTWGDKAIEDFGAISVSDGSRYTRNTVANFEDHTTQYEVIDGQLYWGTHFTNYEMTFSLATDGITEKELADFKFWFKPGICRELILAENPNRAIMARLAEPPSFSFVPFDYDVERTIGARTYTTKTTRYKGEITLKFVMDEPFWYGKKAYFDYEEKKYADDSTKTIVLDDPDFIKVMVEDGIPYVEEMGDPSNVIMANGCYIDFSTGQNSGLVANDTDTTDSHVPSSLMTTDSVDGSEVFDGNNAFVGVVVSTMDGNDGFRLSRKSTNLGDYRYLYYAGTAPSLPTKLAFSFVPYPNPVAADHHVYLPANVMAKNTRSYPLNGKVFSLLEAGNSYNTIQIGDKHFSFSLPNIYKSYNDVIQLFSESTTTYANRIATQEKVRLQIAHPAVRKWALNCLELDTHLWSAVNYRRLLCALMAPMFYASGFTGAHSGNTFNILLDPEKVYECSCNFNLKIGTGTCTYKYNTWPDGMATAIASDTDYQNFIAALSTAVAATLVEETADCWDMVISNDLSIERVGEPILSIENCLLVTTDYVAADYIDADRQGLYNVAIEFQNLYY